MADTVKLSRASSLKGLSGDRRTTECAPMSRFSLRLPDTASAPASDAIGLDLVQPMNSAITNEHRTALRLGPDEWLILAPEVDADGIATALDAALPDRRFSLVDISHRQTAIMLETPHAAAMLNAGCALDLVPAAFPIGMATRTMFFKADIVLWRQEPNRFHVEIWRSFAPYVWSLLAEIGREYPD